MKINRFPVPIWLVLLVGIVAISYSSIFVKWSDAPVSVIAMYRLFLTNLIMLPFLLKYKGEIRSLAWKDGWLLFWSGFALGLHFLFWMGSLRYTSVASSTVILTLEPILVMIGSYWVFKQRTNLRTLLSMLTAITGVILIGWGDLSFSGTSLQGDVLSLLGTLSVAFHMLIGKNLRTRVSAYVYSFFVFFLAGLVLAVYNLAMGFSFSGYSSKEWGIFLLLAIVPTVFGHYLFNWLLKYISATSVSMSVLGEPVGATLLAFWLLGEKVTALQVAAGGIIIFGVWMFMRSTLPEKAKLPPQGAGVEI